VSSGVRYFKAGNNIEAFQCLNQALRIDPENVEGLVARGALNANNGSLGKAVEDFDAALKINPEHKNAKKYACETLIALARTKEEEAQVDEALALYRKILTVDDSHKEALESVKYLERKASHDTKTNVMKDKIDLLIRSDSKKKKKKDKRSGSRKKRRRSRSSSSSSSSSESSDSSSSSSSRERSKKRKGKKAKRDQHEALPSSTGQQQYGYPTFNLAAGHPGHYNAQPGMNESSYNKAVEDFLAQTNDKSHGKKAEEKRSRRSRSRSRDKKGKKKRKEESPSSRKKGKRFGKEEAAKLRSMADIVKGLDSDAVDVDALAQKVTSFISSSSATPRGPPSAETAAAALAAIEEDMPDRSKNPNATTLFVEGMELVVKDLKPGGSEPVKPTAPKFRRKMSPSARALFTGDDYSDHEDELNAAKEARAAEQRSKLPMQAKEGGQYSSSGYVPTWRPEGEDKFTQKMEAAKREVAERERRRQDREDRWRGGGFGGGRREDNAFDVRLDRKTGEWAKDCQS